MKLICVWCCVLVAASAQRRDDRYYTPQTFHDRLDSYQQGLLTPASDEIISRSNNIEPWRQELSWKPAIPNTLNTGPVTFTTAKPSEPWRAALSANKEQQAAILHHKQALSSEGNFRFEYASDNGLAAGEVIEPDGTRFGAYQYTDPSGQIVKVKYRAGKDGFQILEGSHVPKSVEPQASLRPEAHYMHAYEQQRRQYELQQDLNRMMKPQQPWSGQSQHHLGEGAVPHPAQEQHFLQDWHDRGAGDDDGQYRENDLGEDPKVKGPHSFGKGYAFSFEG